MDASPPSTIMQPLWHKCAAICFFIKDFQLCVIVWWDFFLTLCYPAMLERQEYQLWFDVRPGTAGVLKAERHSINPMKNMFTGKQNVIGLTIYQLFDRKQKPAGISLTSVSCDTIEKKSWNHSLERWRRNGEGEREKESTWFQLECYR